MLHDGDLFGPANELPNGANPGAYCTVYLAVNGADALVSFVGDAPSDYPDPRFVARGGATNAVLVLIGKTYRIDCAQPFAVVGSSDPATFPFSVNGERFVQRPVQIQAIQPPGGEIGAFTMSASPSGLGGTFDWSGGCCEIEGSGNAFRYVENMSCSCAGCHATGHCRYKGYALPATGGLCLCGMIGGFHLRE